MPEKSWMNRYGLQTLAYLGVSVALVLSYMGIKALERYDPMAHYSEQYADAGMNNSALVCDDVKVSSRRYMAVNWQFQARHISMKRDLGSWEVTGLHNGSVTLAGPQKLNLKFASKTASYSRWERSLRMQDAAVMPNQGKLTTSEAVYNEANKRLELPKGCSGRYMDADVVFKKVAFNLNTNTAVVTDGTMTVTQKPALAVDHTPKAKKTRQVTVSFKSFEEQQGKTRKGIGLKVVDGETQFQADQATQDIAKNTVLATGNLKMDDAKYSGTGDKADIEIKPRHAVITGHVVIVTKPAAKKTEAKPAESVSEGSKPAKEDKSLATERDKPATITCDKADVLYGTKIITLTGNLKIVQIITDGTRTLTADKAVYDVNAEVMELTGNVYAVDEKGQELRVPSMTLGLKEGEEWIKATQGGTMIIIEEDEE